MTGVVVLAAGAGRRLGGVAKAMLSLPDGRTFLEAIRDTADRAGVSHRVVVCGPPHDRVTRAEAARLGLVIIDNPDPGRGMASSVALGFAHALEHFAGCDRALLWPVDHPAVAVDTVRALTSATTAIAIPILGGRGGHPTAFGREVWRDLAGCLAAPEGARSVIRSWQDRHPGAIERIPIADPAIATDVDTPSDLENL